MKVGISIVVHKTPATQLRTLLQCILATSVDYYVDVIDNSPDATLSAEVVTTERISYIRVENRGYGAAHNVSFKRSLARKLDFHLVVNPDVYWDGDVLQGMVEFMDAHPDCGLGCAATYYPDGSLQRVCRLLPTPYNLIRRCLPSGRNNSANDKYELAFSGYDKIMNVPYIMGSFMFFRVKSLEVVGLFDERFFMYPEDIDISRRVREKFAVLFNPSVKIVHNHTAASRKNFKMFSIHAINMIKYFNKWGWFLDSQRKEINRQLLQPNTPDIGLS